jgi:hypothetical protein
MSSAPASRKTHFGGGFRSHTPRRGGKGEGEMNLLEPIHLVDNSFPLAPLSTMLVGFISLFESEMMLHANRHL